MVHVLESPSGVDIRWGYSQLRHRVPYITIFFEFGPLESAEWITFWKAKRPNSAKFHFFIKVLFCENALILVQKRLVEATWKICENSWLKVHKHECSAIAATNYPSLRNSPNGCQGHLRPYLSPPDRSMVTVPDSNDVRMRSTFIQLLA